MVPRNLMTKIKNVFFVEQKTLCDSALSIRLLIFMRLTAKIDNLIQLTAKRDDLIRLYNLKKDFDLIMPILSLF